MEPQSTAAQEWRAERCSGRTGRVARHNTGEGKHQDLSNSPQLPSFSGI
jgi:hypothetical protein